jgi:hypothetical protein
MSRLQLCLHYPHSVYLSQPLTFAECTIFSLTAYPSALIRDGPKDRKALETNDWLTKTNLDHAKVRGALFPLLLLV